MEYPRLGMGRCLGGNRGSLAFLWTAINPKESSGARQCRREGARPELALRFDATRRPDSPPLARCYPGQENAIASDAFV